MRSLLLLVFAAAGTALSCAVSTTAQSNPPMTSAQFDNQKEGLYAQFVDYKRNPNPEQQRYAYPTAKEYLRLFGGVDDSETKEVLRFVTEYEHALHERELYDAYGARNYLKTFELGRSVLKSNPDDFFVLALLTEAGYENSLAGNKSLNTETIGYARRAVQLIEAGKVSKPDPFKSMDMARGFLNFTLGNFVRDDQPVEAAAAFLKAVQAGDPYHSDPAAYHRLGVATLKGEFTQLSAEYNEKFGNKPPSPEQAAMLQRIQHLVERAIDAYARAVALSTKPEQEETRTKILAQLNALYKNFHNNSDAGLSELISTVLSKPMP
jgi:hypothetical protein